MIISLARQAVIIKCGNDTSILTGNYELAYAVGFLMNQADISLSEDSSGENKAGKTDLRKLREMILHAYEGTKTEDEKIKRLLRMLRLYNPSDEWDEQMGELLQIGLKEVHPFDIHHE